MTEWRQSLWSRFNCRIGNHHWMWTTPELVGRLVGPDYVEMRRATVFSNGRLRRLCMACGRFQTYEGGLLGFDIWAIPEEIRQADAQHKAWRESRIALFEARQAKGKP